MTFSPSPNTSHDLEKCPYWNDMHWRRELLTEGTYKHLVALTSLCSIAIVPTVVLNALVIYAVATRPRLQTKSNALLSCLAGTDLVAGLVSMPLDIAAKLKVFLGVGPFCTALEKLNLASTIVLFFASSSHLVLISVDRYVAIKKPLRYQAMVTKRRIIAGASLAWAATLFVAIQEIVLALINSETNAYSIYLYLWAIIMIIMSLGCMATIVYTYFYIFSETRRQKRLQTEQVSEEEAERIKKDNKAVNTLGIILGTLILTYVPTPITAAVIFSLGGTLEPRVQRILFSWASTFALLGSFFNPVIYCWRMKKMRRAFLEILPLRQPENSPPAIEMQVIQRHGPEIQPTSSKSFSLPVVKQEPVLLSVSHLKAEEIIHIEETHH